MSFVKIKSWLASLSVLALVACGGGGGSGGDPIVGGGSGSVSTAAKIEVTASNSTLGDGESTITVTAIVKDANNVGLPATAVTWAASAGSLTGAVLTTDKEGKATATFSAVDRTAGTATVSAKSGSAQSSINIALHSARKVVLSSSKESVGTDGDTALMTAIVKDSGNVAISGAQVTWSVDVGSLTNQVAVTNAQGVATAVYTPLAGGGPTATVRVNSGSAPEEKKSLQIIATTTKVSLLTSAPSAQTGGEQIVLTAFVTDANNLAKVNAPVSWGATSGRISNQAALTDVNGVARASFDAGSNRENRIAKITATSGLATGSIDVPFVNTKITYSGPGNTTVGTKLNLNLSAVDSRGVAIPGVELSLKSSLGNSIPAKFVTDDSGQAKVPYEANIAGVDSISVSGAGAVLTPAITMTVTGADEALIFLQPVLDLDKRVKVNEPKTIKVRYTKATIPQVGKTLNLAATIGTIKVGGNVSSNVPTDANGEAEFTIQSGFAGSSTVGVTVEKTAVQASLGINFIATVPATLVLQVSPTALAPNLGDSTSNRADLVAKVTDVNGNPVADAAINFSQVADPSGGRLEQASAITDLNGVATVRYQSGATSTASGAVQLKATVAANPAISGAATMTVNQSALFIALGTGNTISNFDTQTYEKNWTVYVTDANGVRVTNVPVTVKAIPIEFGKGEMQWNETASKWIYKDPAQPWWCPNEDGPLNPGKDVDGAPIWGVGSTPTAKPAEYNFNGRLDPGEDRNGDGTLTPGNVVALTASTVVTDSNGSATITMRYAELYAPWIRVRLTATAIVSGTESTSYREFQLDTLAGDFSVKTVNPAGYLSPFGVTESSCINTK